jgi:hypothetical protein
MYFMLLHMALLPPKLNREGGRSKSDKKEVRTE